MRSHAQSVSRKARDGTEGLLSLEGSAHRHDAVHELLLGFEIGHRRGRGHLEEQLEEGERSGHVVDVDEDVALLDRDQRPGGAHCKVPRQAGATGQARAPGRRGA